MTPESSDRVLDENKYYYQELDRGYIVIVFYHGARAMGSIDIKTEEEDRKSVV